MTALTLPIFEPSRSVLISYLEIGVRPFKVTLLERAQANVDLKRLLHRLRAGEASVDDTYLQAIPYLDAQDDRRALDVWFDYHKARAYCTRQWTEWAPASDSRPVVARINVLGLWLVCASLTAANVDEIPILPHVDRLIWHLAHLLDEVVDTRTPDLSLVPRDHIDGIVHTLRALCEFRIPESRASVSRHCREFEHDYLSHQPQCMSDRSLVEQLHHKLIPDTITARMYNDIMALIVGGGFNVERARRAMREAMYVWQVLDDLSDFDQDANPDVANIGRMCLEQANESLLQAAVWPAADQVPRLLPHTVGLMRQVFDLLCHWLQENRCDVLEFLFAEFERVFPEEWHHVLNGGQSE